MQSVPGHTRSSSFISFFKNKKSDSSRPYRTLSNQDMPPQASVPQRPVPPKSQQTEPQAQPPPPNQQLHPEIRSVVQLNHAHAHKVYFSGPLLRKLEFNPDGQRPTKDEGWTEIWAQLGGTTLSVWDMKEIEAASKQGKEVPPSYINVTDAYIQILGSVTAPATPTTPARRFPNVLTVNTAGANLYLFSCQSIPALTSWAAALRLASWEKSRLDEIYTAHLIRITLTARDVPTTIVKGKMEGWARIRIAGQRDWKKVWLVVQEGLDDQPNNQHATNGNAAAASAPAVIRKKRVSIFSSSPSDSNTPPNSMLPLISIFNSPKPKDRKKAPLLTISNVTQAFAVYPERPELISKSTLMKIEGLFDESGVAGAWKGKEGWIFIMPEGENSNGKLSGAVGQGGQVAEMLKWIVALHDAFRLYGRPEAWNWDPRDSGSLMYGYPVGPMKENLFLDREIAEKMDPREDRISIYRAELKKLLQQHMRLPVQVVNPQNRSASGQSAASVPPGGLGLDGANSNPTGVGNGAPLLQSSGTPSSPVGVDGPQLPPLSFGGGVPFPTSNGPNNANAINLNVNNVPVNGNDVPSSRLSTIEESSVVTHNAPQHHQNQTARNAEMHGANGSPGAGAGGTSIPPPIREGPMNVNGAPAVPPKLSPSPMSDASARKSVFLPTAPSLPSLQVSTTSVVPPRFQNQVGLGNSTSEWKTSSLTNFGPPPDQVGSRAIVSPAPNFPNDKQAGAAATHPQPRLVGTLSGSTNNPYIDTVPSKPWTPSTSSPRPQLPTSTSAGTTTTTSSTAATTSTSMSEGQDTEGSKDLLKEPGVMFILGGGSGNTQLPQARSVPGYGAGVGAGVGAGLGTGLGVGTGIGAVVQSAPVLGVADNGNESDDDPSLYSTSAGVHRDGETTSLPSAVLGSNSLAAPAPKTPGSLLAYAGIMDSEDGHQQQVSEKEEQSGIKQQYRPGPPAKRDTPMSFVGDNSSAVPAKAPQSETFTVTKSSGLAPTVGSLERLSPTRFGSGLGRKPSGARELVAPRHGSNLGSSVQSRSSNVGGDNISSSSRTFTEDGSVMETTVGLVSRVDAAGQDDGGVGEEALTALSYLNYADGGERVGGQGSNMTSTDTTAAATLSTSHVPPPPEVFSSSVEPLKARSVPVGSASSGAGDVSDPNETLPYTESSFAPSSKAAERKAKVKAQKDAHLAAVQKPGRANGKRKSIAGTWDSSEEEDDEDEDEDEDVDSDEASRRNGGYKGKGAQQQSGPSGSTSSALGHGRLGSQVTVGMGGELSETHTTSQLRPPRNLPQIPGRRSPGENTFTRRIPSEQYMDGGRRTYYEEGPQIRSQAEAPIPGAQRQTIWTKVLDPGQPVGRPQSEHAAKDTFVQLEPSETMTKAFALHGLLSVGIQDKEDRSAKRQEELARESGGSLINVPNKPPPPQSGLLGYVTAHEKERKREGGLGAALTEREREKRVVEERQRRLDEQQRQQLEQMQQGMMFNPMMNPMMMNMMMNMNMNPMMTGGGMGGMGAINPMMTGGGMGMNPMMGGFGGMMGGGFNPQHMFAAQQAAQAYQQAMMTLSAAGSQVGGPNAGGGNVGEGGPFPPGNNTGVGMLSPAMSGNAGFDPRMSMFGMNSMMGMGMPSMGMGGLGPQMTGMSNFDAMASPGLAFPNGGGGTGMNASPNVNELGVVTSGGDGHGSLSLQPPSMRHSQFSSRTSSPAGRGSPKVSGPTNATNGEYHYEGGRPSRPATPR